jgi:glycine betaine/choline ABC-type transport system substrate-binding protein
VSGGRSGRTRLVSGLVALAALVGVWPLAAQDTARPPIVVGSKPFAES